VFQLEETRDIDARASSPQFAWEAGGTPALPSHDAPFAAIRKSKFVVADLTGKYVPE
jgi:hypothetical protein